MNRKQRKRSEREVMAEKDGIMKEVPKTEWAFDERVNNLHGLTRVFRSKHRVALVFDKAMSPQMQPCIKVMCRDIGSSKLGWADLQKIKNEIFGLDAWGIQYLPPQKEVVDQANMYWFYLFEATK